MHGCLSPVTVKLYLVAGLVFRAVFYCWHTFYICINLLKWDGALKWEGGIYSDGMKVKLLRSLKRQILICELAALNLLLAMEVCSVGTSSLSSLSLAGRKHQLLEMRLGSYLDWLLKKK